MARARARGIAVAASLAAHLGLLGILLVSRPALSPRHYDSPYVKVDLANPCNSPLVQPPRFQAARKHSSASAKPLGAPPARASAEGAPPAAVKAEAAPSALPPAPPAGDGRLSAALRRSGVGCAHVEFLRLTAEERAACAGGAWKSGPDARIYAAEPANAEKAAGFARTVRNNEAWSTYRDTIDGPYPGLRCAFGRDCDEPASGYVRLPR